MLEGKFILEILYTKATSSHLWFRYQVIVLFFTGSRDGCLGVWDTRCEQNVDTATGSNVVVKEPVRWLTSIHEDERFRAIQYNPVSNVCILQHHQKDHAVSR